MNDTNAAAQIRAAAVLHDVNGGLVGGFFETVGERLRLKGRTAYRLPGLAGARPPGPGSG